MARRTKRVQPAAMTDEQKQQLTLDVGRQVLDLVEQHGCQLKVWPTLTPDGRIVCQMSVFVKEQPSDQ